MAHRDVVAGTLDRLVRAPARAKAVARVREGRVEEGREDLQEGLLDESSSTVGIPSVRAPRPSGLGMSTRRTGCGM
jgi:hypothetical protein